MSLHGLEEISRRTLLKRMGVSGAALVMGNTKADGHDKEEASPSPVQIPGDAYLISSKHAVVIVIPQDGEPLIRMGADRLAEYIRRVTGLEPRITASSDGGGVPSAACAIVLAKRPISYFRPDGYRITTGHEPGRRVINIYAPDSVGLKYGSYRLIREMRQQGHELHVPVISLEANPWLKTREIFVADLDWRGPTATEKNSLPTLQEKFDWPNWEIPRLEQYVDLVDAMGYNSLMLTDPHALVAFSGGFASSIESIVDKVAAMYRRAHQNGMQTAFFLWGQAGTGLMAHDFLAARNDPYVNKELADTKEHWESLIEQFGPCVDRWVLHWADPGGCHAQQCTINTPQVMTNQFTSLLRQKGFQSDVSFSLWGLRWGSDSKSRPWPGYIDWKSVIESGVLSPDIGICMMRRYTYEQAHAITDQSRKAGVWGWYLNDMEVNPSLHVHDHVLEKEFGRVDQSASDLLDWFSLEDNNHCLNPPTVYLGARLLWDTCASAVQVIEEFCRAVWGSAASPMIAQALRAIADVRCGPGRPMLKGNLWPDDYLCWFGKGSPSPAQDVDVCEKALRALESVKLDAEFVCQLPLIVEPDELLGYIRSHLSYVLDFARIRLGYKQALKLAQEKRFEEAQEELAALPDLPDFIPGVYGAGMETFYYGLLRRFVNTWKGRTFRDNLALGKIATASSWFNQDPRFAPDNAVNGILCEFEEEGWAAGALGPAWLKIDLGTVETVRNVRIYNRGYRRELWDNNLVATPGRANVFCAVNDPDPSRGLLEDREAGYKLIGGFEGWAPTDDPGAYQEIKAKSPIPARFIKVIFYLAANDQRVGCGEVEVRGA